MRGEPIRIVRPELTEEASYASLDGELAAGGAYSEMALRQRDLSGSRASDLRFEQVAFAGTLLRRTT